MARWLCGAIVLGALVSVLALSPATAQRRGGAITYVNAASPGTLDPHVAGNLADLEVIHHLFETLVAMDESYNARPLLASSVVVSNEARSFRFTLRRGVRFHDGDEMRSADVLASFERYARVSTNAALLADVDRYETPDPYSFVVHLRRTNAVFLDMLKTPTYPLAILPADQKDKPGHEIEIVGTGPFVLDAWDKDSHLVLRRNDTYAANNSAPGPDGFAGRKTVYLDTVRYTFLADANARLAALQANQADITANLPPDIARRMTGRADLTTLDVFPYCQQVFVTHASNGLTANPLIRQAIRAVVNVDEILTASGHVAQRNHSLVYAGSPYYTGDAMRQYYDRRNVAEARALLARAGYRGEKLVLQTNATFSYMRDAILVLAELLKEAGVNTDVQVLDWPTNLTNLQRGTGNWNVSTTGFCSQPLLGPQQWKSVVFSFPQIRDEKVLEAAYRKFFASLELGGRQAAWLEIEERMLEQAYFIKVADLGASRGNNTRVRGLTPYFFQRSWNIWVN